MSPRPRRLAILGSTGSIGTSTLEVVDAHPDRLAVAAIAGGSNWQALHAQIMRYRPSLAVVFDPLAAAALAERLGPRATCRVVSGFAGLDEAVSAGDVDLVVSAVVGSIGLRPVLTAIEAGKTIALANKETLVMGGELVMAAARRHRVEILPVDSEHSAIFQCLGGRGVEGVERLILTASGGPFRDTPVDRLTDVLPAAALAHPNWSMGAKVTIDSATLMNKGLEVIEAHWLFGIPFDRIEVVIHPQSIVHSMVEMVDGSLIAQMGEPDMRGPIQVALSHPERWPAAAHRTRLLELPPLTFAAPRWDDFPCLRLAFAAGRRGGTAPCILNAANEIAVAAFLDGRIGFAQIAALVARALDETAVIDHPDLAALMACDRRVRQCVTGWLPPRSGRTTKAGSITSIASPDHPEESH